MLVLNVLKLKYLFKFSSHPGTFLRFLSTTWCIALNFLLLSYSVPLGYSLRIRYLLMKHDSIYLMGMDPTLVILFDIVDKDI